MLYLEYLSIDRAVEMDSVRVNAASLSSSFASMKSIFSIDEDVFIRVQSVQELL
jgi:hypothetical protein